MTNTLTNISKSAGGHSGQGGCFDFQKVGANALESAEYQDFDVPTYLHTQEVTGSSPVVSTKSLETKRFQGFFLFFRKRVTS